MRSRIGSARTQIPWLGSAIATIGQRRPLPAPWRLGCCPMPVDNYHHNHHRKPFSIGSGVVILRPFSTLREDRFYLSPSQWNDQTRALLKAVADGGLCAASVSFGVDGNDDDKVETTKEQVLHNALGLLDNLCWLTRQGKSGEKNEFLYHRNNGTLASPPSLDANLAWKLLDLMVTLEEDLHGSVLSHNASSQDFLNVVLQLWRQSIVADQSSFPPPKQVLEKLDDYRLHSTCTAVMPDIQSFNIILAAAGSLGDIDTCRQLYQWMRSEGRTNSSIKPDRITLRNMFQAISLHSSSNQQQHGGEVVEAAKECEQLVQQYLTESSSHDAMPIYQALIHVWALADPWQARAYLLDIAQQYRDSLPTDQQQQPHHSPPPPPIDTLDWNRVISALAIQHGQPQAAYELLQEFWTFTEDLQQRLSSLQYPQQKQRHQNFAAMTIPQPDLFSYNSILEGWARLKDTRAAVEANKIYTLIRRSENLQPNIVTYTSAIKANGGDVDRVNKIAQECLEAARYKDGEDGDYTVILDHAFFNAWLQACIQAATTTGQEGKDVIVTGDAIATAQDILLKIIPKNASHIPRTKTLYGSLLQCFLIQDDLEGATQFLLQHLTEMDEETMVMWTIELYHKGDIQLSSFVDRLRGKKPKTLLQVLLEGNHLQSSQVLEQLLKQLSATQAIEALQWIPAEYRYLSCFAQVMQTLAKEGNAQETEDLFHIAEQSVAQTRNRMIISSPSTARTDPQAWRDMYTSMIVAWSKQGNIEKTIHWWNIWMQQKDLVAAAPPTRVAPTAVLTCFVSAHQPKEAQQFWNELHNLRQSGHLDEEPDLVMCNLVLKAWVMAASGRKAEAFLELVQTNHPTIEPDAISHNSVVQAYVKARQLTQAMDYVAQKTTTKNTEMTAQSQHGNGNTFPDLATFRSIMHGWSLHRQDYQLASQHVTFCLNWMKDLYHQGILKDDPTQDREVQFLIHKTQERYHQSLTKKKQVDQNGTKAQGIK